MFDVANQYFLDVVSGFYDPRKRLFLGYLLSALIIALLWLVLVGRFSFVNAIKKVVAKSVWLSTSAKADYQMFFINKLLMLVISPLLLTQLALAASIFYWLYELNPTRPIIFEGLSYAAVGLIFTLCYFVLDDFARFYVHRLMHKWEFLWSFHKVHHSAEVLTPMTVFRTHPVESILFSLRSIIVQGVAIGGFIFFLGDKADLVTVFGANIFTFLFNVLGSNLRHSHVSIYYWRPIECLFISPAQHHIHHSTAVRHWDKNYGVTLAIWDGLFGSLYHSEKDVQLSFGLKQGKVSNNNSLYNLYFSPFLKSVNVVKSIVMYFCKKSVKFSRY